MKLGTWLERVDSQTTTTVQADVSARSTAGLLVCKTVAVNGGKALNAYSQSEFQAVVDSPRCADVETSLTTAFTTASKGQDTWTVPTVAQVTMAVAADISASLGLGGTIKLNLGGSTSGGSTSASGTVKIGV